MCRGTCWFESVVCQRCEHPSRPPPPFPSWQRSLGRTRWWNDRFQQDSDELLLWLPCNQTLRLSWKENNWRRKNPQKWMEEIYLNTVSTSCLEFEWARHRDRTRRFSKVMKTKASWRNPVKELTSSQFLLNNLTLRCCPPQDMQCWLYLFQTQQPSRQQKPTGLPVTFQNP